MNRLARREVYREFAISGVHTAELGLKRGNAGLRRRVSIEGIGDEWQVTAGSLHLCMTL